MIPLKSASTMMKWNGLTMTNYKKFPAPDLRSKCKPGKTVEVTFPVSYRYNGGIEYEGKYYAGFKVPAPILKPGFKLISIGVLLQLNARPPYATMLLREKK